MHIWSAIPKADSRLCPFCQSFGEDCADVLPVKVGSLNQGVGIPVLNHHVAAQTHKALRVILVFSGHLEPQTNWADLQKCQRDSKTKDADGEAAALLLSTARSVLY